MPTPVEIDAVPIVVESTPEEYFVLYASLDLDAGTTVEVPVLVAPGAAGTTTLAENVEALPNELPRVGGIVTTVPQTPLSHVNLRAVQDKVPNAYIRGALDDEDVAALIGGWVHYSVTESGWSLSAATPAEVDAHYASSRPAQTQTPQRDLSVTSITLWGPETVSWLVRPPVGAR